MPVASFKSNKQKPLRAVGAYVFAGGFTVGVKEAKFEVLCHLEESNYGVATARRNLSDVPVHTRADSWPLDSLENEDIDFVYGNPPCAAWSVAGSAGHHGGSWRDSPLVECTRRHFSLLARLRPKVWAWESVQNAWKKGESFVRELADEAAKSGYSTTVWLHDAVNLGVPQRRKRFFMLCHNIELMIEQSYCRAITIDEALASVVEIGDPIEHNIKKVSYLLPSMRQGMTLKAAWESVNFARKLNANGQVAGRPSFAVVRPRSGAPSPVIRHEVVHPTEDRGLSENELKALCGFPADFKFIGSGIPHQIGRGVCPPVAAHLAKCIANALRRSKKIKPRFTVIDHTTRRE